MEIRFLLNLFGTFIIYTGNTSAEYCKTHTNQFERDGDNVIVSFQAITIDENDSSVLLINRLLSPHNEQLLAVSYRNGNFDGTAAGFIGCHSVGNYEAGNLSCRIDIPKRTVYGTYKLAVNDVNNIYTCITVFILGKPTRPAISTDKIYTVGETLSITCSSNSTTQPSNSDIKLVYTWKVDEVEPTHKRYNYPFNDRHVLAISDVQREDVKKLFKCYARENVSNSYTSYSSVSFSPHLFYGPETVTFVPSVIGYNIDENALFGPITCNASCYRPCTFTWEKVGQDKNNVFKNSSVLDLGTVSRQDSGTYRCTAISSKTGNITESKSKDLTVEVLYPITVTDFYFVGHKGRTNLTLSEHYKNISFVCDVASFRIADIRILLNGRILKIVPQTDSLLLTISEISCLDHGQYICEGRTPQFKLSRKELTLFVECSPRPSKKMSQNVTTLIHVPVTLTFAVIANPPPGPNGFKWYKYNGGVWTRLLVNENRTISSFDFVTYMTIWNVSKEDIGEYRISVSNVFGSYDHNMFLNVARSTSSPELTSSNESAVVTDVVMGLLVAAISVYAVVITVLCIRKKSLGFKGEKDPTQLAPQSAQIQPASTYILSTEQHQQTVPPQQQQQQTPVQYDDVEIVELRQVYTDLLHYEDSNNINMYDDLNPSV